jgi:hypothetical protein
VERIETMDRVLSWMREEANARARRAPSPLSSDRDFGRQGIDAAFDVKTTTMTRSEQKTD